MLPCIVAWKHVLVQALVLLKANINPTIPAATGCNPPLQTAHVQSDDLLSYPPTLLSFPHSIFSQTGQVQRILEAERFHFQAPPPHPANFEKSAEEVRHQGWGTLHTCMLVVSPETLHLFGHQVGLGSVCLNAWSTKNSVCKIELQTRTSLSQSSSLLDSHWVAWGKLPPFSLNSSS